MDVGRKCLLMAIVGVILTLVSSPFVINMAFTGKPLITITLKEVLEPFPPNEYQLNHTIIVGAKKIGTFYLNPEREKIEQYRVSLNIVTNGTINLLIFRMNSTDTIQNSFNAGNHTIEDLRITGEGIYVLNATSTGNSTVNAAFKITESWFIRTTEWEEQIDLMRTLGSSIGFAIGLVMIVYSLITLRREAKKAYPETAEETRGLGYTEFEEE